MKRYIHIPKLKLIKVINYETSRHANDKGGIKGNHGGEVDAVQKPPSVSYVSLVYVSIFWLKFEKNFILLFNYFFVILNCFIY